MIPEYLSKINELKDRIQPNSIRLLFSLLLFIRTGGNPCRANIPFETLEDDLGFKFGLKNRDPEPSSG
jgi:hypothetical protein